MDALTADPATLPVSRSSALKEEEGMSYLAEMETDAALAPLQSAACRVSSQAKAQPHSFPWRARAQREASF